MDHRISLHAPAPPCVHASGIGAVSKEADVYVVLVFVFVFRSSIPNVLSFICYFPRQHVCQAYGHPNTDSRLYSTIPSQRLVAASEIPGDSSPLGSASVFRYAI